MLKRTPVWADFNNVHSDGYNNVHTLTKFSGKPLNPGDEVVVRDGEGNECQATVVSIDMATGIVDLQIDLGTFAPHE